MRRNLLVRGLLVLTLLCTAAMFGQNPPARNISGRRHPNLNAAQRLTQQAYDKIVAAQQANEWDMEGHAAKAKDLLDQANRELKQAAQAANKNAK